ncbi:snare region anchored in the vesicle membrane C-terminus-domain-containing protein, partial [Gorgonomyces haynaldii]
KPEQRKLVSNQIKRELEEADEIIGQMEMELASQPAMTRSKLQQKTKEYKESLKNVKKEVQKQQASERDQLLGNGDLESQVQDQRQRLLQGTERLEQASRRLEESQRIALETEQLGISTLGDLHRQRQQIERTRDGLGNADSWISKSSGLLKLMQKR